MGNTPSAEMPRKLLKSRPTSLALDSPPDESQGLSSPSSTRYCHSYLAGSRHTLSYQHLPSPPSHDAHSLYRQPSVASISPSAPSSPWRQPEPFDTVVGSHAPSVGPDASGSDIRRRLIRAKSVVYPSDCSLQSLTRTYSFHSKAYIPYNPHALLHRPFPDHRRYSTMDSVHSPDGYAAPLDMELPLPLVDDSVAASAQATESGGHSGRQERAASTSYVPMRRRSVIQTPGVATRAAKDQPPLPTMPVLRVRRSTPAVRPAGGSPVLSDEPASPTSSNGRELHERSVTPCDANYRQLGGIKFGTLRITNGSPVLGSAALGDDCTAPLASPPVTSAPFGIQGPTWPLRELVVTNPAPGASGAGPEFHLGPPRKGYGARSLGIDQKQVACSPPTDSPRPPDCQTSPRANEETKSNECPSDSEYIAPEVLDFRVELVAVAQPIDDASSRPSDKSQDESVGSDSGFISSSTSSRQSSQRTLHKADSGYSSNLSIRSMRSNPSKLHRDGEKLKRAFESALSKDEAPQHFIAQDDDPSRRVSHPRNSFAQTSRQKLRRLSTRTGKIQTLSPSASCDQLAGPATQTVMRRATTGDVGSATPRSSPGKQETPSKQGRLHRLLGSGRRHSRVIPFMAPHHAPDPVPAIPVNLEEKLHGRDEQLANKQPSRTEPQQQPRKAVWTEDVTYLATNRQQGHGDGMVRETQGGRAALLGMQPHQALTALPVPPHGLPHSTRRSSMDLPPPPTPTTRRPYPGPNSESRGARDGSSSHQADVSSPTRTRRTLDEAKSKDTRAVETANLTQVSGICAESDGLARCLSPPATSYARLDAEQTRTVH